MTSKQVGSALALLGTMVFWPPAAFGADETVTAVSVPAVGHPVVARVDAGGTIHLMGDSEEGPKYARSTDGGETFSEPIRVLPGVSQAAGLEYSAWDLAVGKGGRVHVAMSTNAWKLKLPQEEWGFFYASLDPGSNAFTPVRNLNRDCLNSTGSAAGRVDRSVEGETPSWCDDIRPRRVTVTEGPPMFKLPVRTWILNAAAVLAAQHGAVTRQAEQAQCSRETVYEHATKVQQRLERGPDDSAVAELRAENQRLRDEIAALRRAAEDRVRCGPGEQRRLATAAFAMGVSLRQIEELLGVLLPAAAVPDHSTLGHWVQAEARRAGAALRALDTACAPQVETLALDEIFFGGARRW
jgi:hypothetical protein